MTKPQVKNLRVYDFTISCAKCPDRKELIKVLDELCKKWVFQQEKGEKTEYLHWQIRASAKVRTRWLTLIKQMPKEWKPSASITSNGAKDDDFYVMKALTRVDGPWDNKNNKPVYIPRQIREIKALRDWQSELIDRTKVWDTRHIDLIYCKKGNIGKSILKGYMRVHKLATSLPFVNNYKDLLRMVCDLPTAKAYIIDLPRAIKKENLNQMYAAIETIKDGYAYDDRYHFKDKYFDCPNIWVFTNTLPDLEDFMSEDRWRIWIVKNEKLKRYH